MRAYQVSSSPQRLTRLTDSLVTQHRFMKKSLLYILLPFWVYSQNIATEEIALKNGDIDIPGTLTYPMTQEKVPLVIFIHGSGNIDRNGNQAGMPVQANYIKTLADSLNVRGVAFFRYDKRTAAAANLAKVSRTLLTDFVADVTIAIDRLAKDDRFSSIHLIGHSQGSLVAMLALDPRISKFISLAGPGRTIDRSIIAQLESQNADFARGAQEYFQELRETDTILDVNPFLRSIFAPENHAFLRQWITLDPTVEIAKITIPVLILNGEADFQVTVEDAENLQKALPTAQMKLIPKMNHVLKEVGSMTENMQSYSDESFPLSRTLVDAIALFIKS